MIEQACLYLVGTPIGNMDDLSPRAAAALAQADCIACEDTRVTARLLSALDISIPLISYHAHNFRSRQAGLLDRLRRGERVCLVSDAGMPCISDPGFELVEACVAEGIRVSVLPGPSAVIMALAASGLDSRRFVFEGFLPVKGRERRERLMALANEERTAVLYEAPHRLVRSLQDLSSSGMGRRKLALGREMTKKYEEFLYFTVDQALEYYAIHEPRGEFALVLEGNEAMRRRLGGGAAGGGQPVQQADNRPAGDRDEALQQLRGEITQELKAGSPVKAAAQRWAQATSCSRKQAYNIVQGWKDQLK